MMDDLYEREREFLMKLIQYGSGTLFPIQNAVQKSCLPPHRFAVDGVPVRSRRLHARVHLVAVQLEVAR